MSLALHAEWTKLRTLAGTWWLLLAAAALTVTVSAATAADFHCMPGACTPQLTSADPARLGLAVLAAWTAAALALALFLLRRRDA